MPTGVCQLRIWRREDGGWLLRKETSKYNQRWWQIWIECSLISDLCEAKDLSREREPRREKSSLSHKRVASSIDWFFCNWLENQSNWVDPKTTLSQRSLHSGILEIICGLFSRYRSPCCASRPIRPKCYLVDITLQKKGEEFVLAEKAKQVLSQVGFAKLPPRWNGQKTDADFDRSRRMLYLR